MNDLPVVANVSPPAQPHPGDICAEGLFLALSQTHRQDLLAQLISTSRKHFGFFTKHFAHTVNYVWLLERLEGLEAASRVLDIGAGVSPLPLLLSLRGHSVHSIDGSQVQRRLPAEADWNEWGF